VLDELGKCRIYRCSRYGYEQSNSQDPWELLNQKTNVLMMKYCKGLWQVKLFVKVKPDFFKQDGQAYWTVWIEYEPMLLS